MKELTLFLPKPTLRDMANGKTPELTFNTDELGFPLRIHLQVRESEPVKKYGGLG